MDTPIATPSVLSLIEKIRKFEDEYRILLEKYNLVPSISIDFPVYKKLPDHIKLALAVINKEDHEYRISYKENK